MHTSARPDLHRTPCKNHVIAKPVRTPAVAIRSPRPWCRGITDSHDQSVDWSRNDTQFLLSPVIAKPVRTLAVAIRASRLRSCLRRLPFFLRRKKGRKERRQNQWFWNPFRGQGTARSGTLQPRELSTAKFAPCIRIVSASPSATRSALVLAWRDGGNLCVCRRAA